MNDSRLANLLVALLVAGALIVGLLINSVVSRNSQPGKSNSVGRYSLIIGNDPTAPVSAQNSFPGAMPAPVTKQTTAPLTTQGATGQIFVFDTATGMLWRYNEQWASKGSRPTELWEQMRHSSESYSAAPTSQKK